MEVESRVDSLTGLFNRRGFDEIFGRLVDGSQRTGRPLGLIYLDSDSLKRINNEGGHEAGDRFIVDLASVLRSVVRRADFIFRWGGDEFAVILEGGEAERAVVLGERIREAVSKRTEGTVSIGVYCGVPDDAGQAVRIADVALYAAKDAGKDADRQSICASVALPSAGSTIRSSASFESMRRPSGSTHRRGAPG